MYLLYEVVIDTLEKGKIVRAIYKDCEAEEAIYQRHKFSRYKELETQRDIL